MSLRRKLLMLFTLLGVLPLCALGVASYRQQMHALEAMLARETLNTAERAADGISQRYGVVRSDLLLLAENQETQQLLRAHAAGEAAEVRARLGAAAMFYSQLWQQISPSYRSIDVRDARGSIVYAFGSAGNTELEYSGDLQALRFDQVVLDAQSGRELGRVVALVGAAELLRAELLASGFGQSAQTMVIDRITRRVVYHPSHTYMRQPVPHWMTIPAEAMSGQQNVIAAMRLRAGDSVRVASAVALAGPAWLVVSSTALEEFAPPFRAVLRRSLFLLLFVVAVVSIAFMLASHRLTRSLEALTAAADAVGKGHFSPALPDAGSDEIGRLSAAFGLMTRQVREMMAQLERSRQMAAIGEFAAEIAHEVRNPLTSIKLNLQRIKRLIASGRIASDAARPLEISMRAIARMERVVTGVLRLGRAQHLGRDVIPLNRCIHVALSTISSQARAQHVRLEFPERADLDRVCADAPQIEAALINIMLNALDAMPGGGTLSVTSTTKDNSIVVQIRDTGPGIPDHEHANLFKPFYTTKPSGTGLGLATALRTVQEHGGTLTLQPSDGATGAVFRITLSLADAGVAA